LIQSSRNTFIIDIKNVFCPGKTETGRKYYKYIVFYIILGRRVL